MTPQEARAVAAQYQGSLQTFLQAVFGDVAQAEKFVRFTLQRWDVDFDEIEGDGSSPRALFALAREICREYVSAATFARLPLAAGDDALPLAGVLPTGQPGPLVLALPRAARLSLRLLVVDGLAPSDIEPLFGFSTVTFSRFLERVGQALPPDGKHARLAPALADMATLLSPDPVAVAVRSDAQAGVEPIPAQGRSEVDTTQPGARFTPPAADAGGATNVGGRRTTRTAVSADSGSVPRGVSLSPLVTGGHPANRTSGGSATPFTRPFPTRTVAALPEAPASTVRTPAIAAVLVAFLLSAWQPLSGFLGKPGATKVKAAAASLTHAVQSLPQLPPPPKGAIGVLDLPSGQVHVMPGQNIVAPVRGEAHVILDGIHIWLAASSKAAVWADRIVLADGIARIQVAQNASYVGIADPLQLNLTAGTYVLRKSAKSGAGLATLTGCAIACGKTGSGMKIDAGRSVTMGKDGAEARDLPAQMDESWGREASRIARAVADAGHFSSLPTDLATLPAGAVSTTGASGRTLYSATGRSTVAVPGTVAMADRGAAGYRQAF